MLVIGEERPFAVAVNRGTAVVVSHENFIDLFFDTPRSGAYPGGGRGCSSMGCRLCQNTKQMTFTKTRGVYVNRQASCVITMLFM